MSDYTLELEEDPQGNLLVTFPDDVIDTLNWMQGDVLSWKVKGAGIVIRKVNEDEGYEPLEL